MGMRACGATKVLIAAGGTGGHVFPGVAIAEEIARLHPEAVVAFAGTARGLEARIVPQLGWPVILMRSDSIKDRSGAARILAWARLPLSVVQALGVLRRERPQLIISIGGYAAGPLSVAGWLQGVPFVIVEPNAIAGLTHRILGRLARRAFIAFEEAAPFFAKQKTILSGNPVRQTVVGARREGARAGAKALVFVFGGSQGARRLNQAMVEAMAGLTPWRSKIRILHQTGASDDAKDIEKAYARAGVEAEVFAFTERIWECYREADLVIARAGATTVAELSVLGIPSILVPYPHAADDHQRANAQGMVRRGGAIMVDDAECTGTRIARELAGVIEAPHRLEKMRRALAGMGRPNAARVIVEECWKVIS